MMMDYIVSPPSRRGRDRGAAGADSSFESSTTTNDATLASGGKRPLRGRQFDRHSGTGIV